MTINLPKTMKSKIKDERSKVFTQMCKPEISPQEWELLNRKYQAYSDMIKPSWTITPDAILFAATNLGGILLVLNYEKLDIIRSKAFGLLFKGRV